MIEVLVTFLVALNVGLIFLLLFLVSKVDQLHELNNALLKALVDIGQTLDAQLPPTIRIFAERESEADDPAANIGTFGGPANWN